MPPERLRKITSTMGEVSVIDIPIRIPIGVMTAKMPKKSRICLVVNPVRANDAPKETAAAALWIMIPAASYPASSTSVIRPKAMPSNREWTPRASTRIIAEVLLTVTSYYSTFFF